MDFLVNVLPAIPVLLAHLSGVVAAIILLFRHDRKPIPTVLALIGFGLLLMLDLATFVRGPLIRLVLHGSPIGSRVAVAGVRCCCGLLDVAAIVCLIVAIWEALSRTLKEEGG